MKRLLNKIANFSDNNKRMFLIYGYLFLVFIVFLIISSNYFDPDFGWHLRMGEIISSEKGVPKTDPFSYTMSDFPFIDHEWLTNLLINFLYPHFGYLGTAAFFSSIAIFVLVITFRGNLFDKKTDFLITFAHLILFSSILIPYFGIRPQVISWLFYALYLNILFDEKKFQRRKYLMVFLTVLWVNMHGSFPVSLLTLSVVSVFRSIRKMKIDIEYFFILVLSFFSTGINPYGFSIWREVFQQITDKNLWKVVGEWQPTLFAARFSFALALSLFSIFIYRERKKFKLEEKMLFILMLFEGLSSLRHFPFFVITALPMSVRSLDLFQKEIKKFQNGSSKFRSFVYIIFALVSISLLSDGVYGLTKAYSFKEENYYPPKAATYLSDSDISGNIFSNYDWGGYLIWKLPERKVFIDGRMPSWGNGSVKPDQESSAMDEYLAVVLGREDYQKIFEKYEINTVLWPKRDEENIYIFLGNKKSTILSEIYSYMGVVPDFNFIKTLENDGWRVVYEDNTSVVYQKN